MDQLQTPPAPGVYRYVVSEDGAGSRLDVFLTAQNGLISRGLVRRVIDIGGVHVDGRRTRKCGTLLRAGQGVELYIDGLSLHPYTLDPSHILYEDKYLIALNKPAGVVTQPTPARYRGSLYDALQRYLSVGRQPSYKPSIGMVQRLDRDTSGVIIFSIHARAHKQLTRMVQDRSLSKTYRILVAGQMAKPSGVIRSQLARRRANNRTVSVQNGGRYAETRYELKKTWGVASLAEVELITGRTHQIRAHFSERGHPLLGDNSYGGPLEIEQKLIPRQMLHSWRLKLRHPVTEEPLNLEAPDPEDFQELLEFLDHR